MMRSETKKSAPRKRHALPKRFTVSLSEPAYARLRALNARFGLGNNYLLTVLLENLDELASERAVARVFARFIAAYGAPPPGSGMRR